MLAIKIAIAAGSGNADTYISADATHPTNVGYDYLGDLVALYVRQGIAAL